MSTGLLGWASFWATYWSFSYFIPYNEKSQQIIPSEPVIKVVARNMMLSLPYSIMLWDLSPDIGSYLPHSYLIRFIMSVILMDGWFYMIHRLLHTKWFYKWHKQHHQFHIPYPLVAVYCSPIEALLCDVTAMGLGPCFLKMEGIEMCIWMILAALHSLFIHSSLNHGADHNIHHGKNLSNYGLLSIFDRMFGTYQP